MSEDVRAQDEVVRGLWGIKFYGCCSDLSVLLYTIVFGHPVSALPDKLDATELSSVFDTHTHRVRPLGVAISSNKRRCLQVSDSTESRG